MDGGQAVGVGSVSPDEQYVQQHAEAPHIDREVVRLLRELLGRPVRPCADATARAHLLVGVVHRDRRAEVDHLRTIAANCAYDLAPSRRISTFTGDSAESFSKTTFSGLMSR